MTRAETRTIPISFGKHSEQVQMQYASTLKTLSQLTGKQVLGKPFYSKLNYLTVWRLHQPPELTSSSPIVLSAYV